MDDKDANATSIEQQVIDGEVWNAFCDHLKQAGQQILRPETPDDAFTRAEGWRYLTRLTRIALDMFMECSDRDFPTFYMPSHETAKIGADNPDNLYLRAEIDGNHQYRVSGSRGSVHYLGLIAIAGGYEDSDARMQPVAAIDTHQGLEANADGSIEILLSREAIPGKESGNWLQLTEDTCAVLVRQTFLDRGAEEPARLTIERVNASEKPLPLSAEQVAQNLRSTTAFVEGTARLFADWAQGYLPRPNELPPADQAVCRKAGGDPNIIYYHGYFELEDDQALVVEVERIPECQTWNLQVDNYWMESLDYRYHQIHVNKHTARYESDGSVRIVISKRDPGLPNWLETTGHKCGTLCFRWVGAAEQVDPVTRVVSLSDLKGSET